MPTVSLQLLGGRVRGLTQAAVGEQALRVLDTLRVDIAFIGTNGISVRHGLSTPDSEEAAVKRAMVRSANYVVVVADSSKVGREDFVSFAPISSVDTLITDTEISDADRAELTEQGVEVVDRMIVTVTPNPSIDRTVTLASPLTRGAVHRVSSVTTEPGGKGVNVARALTLAGVDAVAVLPASGTDPLVDRPACRGGPVPLRAGQRRRAHQPHDHRNRRHHNQTQRTRRACSTTPRTDALTRSVVGSAETRPGWCCPVRCRPGMPDGWYADVVAQLAPFACRVAVDTSEAPAGRAGRGVRPGRARPDQAERRGTRRLIGFSAEALEAAVAQGDPEPVVSAARD